MKLRISGTSIFSLVLTFLLMIMVLIAQGLFSLYSAYLNNLIAFAVLIYSILLVVRYRKNIVLAIMFLAIAYANWSIVVGVYFDSSIRSEGLYNQFYGNLEIYSRGITAMLFFVMILYMGSHLYEIKASRVTDIWNVFRPNPWIKWICMFLFICIFVTQYTFVSGARGVNTALNEYKSLIFLFGSLFSQKNNKFDRNVWTVLVVFSSFSVMLNGNRVSVIAPLIILIIVWYQETFTLRKIIILAVPGVLFLTMIGITRGNYSESNILQIVWNKISSEKFVTDTFTFAYVPSLASEAMIDIVDGKGIVLWKNLLYVFEGGLNGEWLLPTYTKEYFFHYGGYIAPTYLDFWLGWVGGIVTGVLVQIIIHLAMTSKKKVFLVVLIGLSSFVFRWYVYNYMQIFRTSLILIVMYYMCVLASKINFKIKNINRLYVEKR